MGELLDTLTEASPDANRSASGSLARLLAQSSSDAKGAQSLTNGLSRTLDEEGGARSFARLLSRLTTTADGANDTGGMLSNLSNSSTGSETMARLLARSTASQDGARQVLDSFSRIAARDGGAETANDILTRLSETAHGAKFLANLASDGQNARSLAALLERLGNTDAGRARLGAALDRMQGSDMELLLQRAADSPELSRVLEGLKAQQEGTESASTQRDANRSGTSSTLQPRSKDDEPAHALIAAATASEQGKGGNQGSGQDSDLNGQQQSDRSRDKHAAPPDEQPDDSTTGKSRFRPKDVYSQSTLRAARICGDCGFRTTPTGSCPRCEELLRRELLVIQARAVPQVA